MTHADIERFTRGGRVGVDVGAIERDLASLWRRASAANTAVTRACSWNLVVHTTTDAERARAQGLVESLVSAVPSRTLILNHRQGGNRPANPEPEIEAFVTANCRMMPGGGKLVCAEEITIEARGRGDEHLPSLVRALLVPDIPTALLWANLPPPSAVVQELLAGVDRVVLDSTRAPSLAPIAGLGPKLTARVADLNWLRGAGLRLVIAAAFDSPTDVPMLQRLSRLDIEASPRALCSARLLLGWLGARLSWGAPLTGADHTGHRWVLPRQDGAVAVEVSLTDGKEDFSSLTFETADGQRLQLRLVESVARIESKSGVRAIPLALHRDEELVVAALGSRGNDPLYQGALMRALELER